ncbi:MAG TPA: lipoate--protein ligase [Anaerolineae bacterium]|nr:lipoate--protein ligase [Anaerolineae bacterium]
MLYVDNQNITDPRINLAIEEHLLRNVSATEPILLFYINEPAVIIGRNQNSVAEIDPDFVEANDIHVVRRLSGGGAVYHDLGNLNFSFVTNGRDALHNFAKFTDPVITVLQELGVAAELRGKSDIFADGKKISGNAQYAAKERMFSHGTLLFDTDLAALLKAINPRQAEITSKAVQSIRNFVTNIRELLDNDMDIYQFRAALLRGIFGADNPPVYELGEGDWRQIEQIAEERYRRWEWNYGRSPQFNIHKKEKFPAGAIEARIDVSKGRIQAVKFYGDFTGERDVTELESFLVGVPYDRGALTAVFAEIDLSDYFGPVEKDAFLTFLSV